jgi:hypothetical protein
MNLDVLAREAIDEAAAGQDRTPPRRELDSSAPRAELTDVVNLRKRKAEGTKMQTVCKPTERYSCTRTDTDGHEEAGKSGQIGTRPNSPVLRRMAELALKNRCTLCGVPRVRIPPSPPTRLVACLCRESLPPKIVQTYPRLVVGVVPTIGRGERGGASFLPMSALLSPASAYAVPFARRDPKQPEGASLSTCSNSDSLSAS